MTTALLRLSLGFRQSNVSQCASPHNPTAITAEEYFDPEFNLNSRDIGRPVELTSKVQRCGAAAGTAKALTWTRFAKKKKHSALVCPPLQV